MLVFAKNSLVEHIKNIKKHTVGTGIMGFLGILITRTTVWLTMLIYVECV